MKVLGGIGGVGFLLSWMVPHALPFFVAGLAIGAALAWLGRGYSERRTWERFVNHATAEDTVRGWSKDVARIGRREGA